MWSPPRRTSIRARARSLAASLSAGQQLCLRRGHTANGNGRRNNAEQCQAASSPCTPALIVHARTEHNCVSLLKNTSCECGAQEDDTRHVRGWRRRQRPKRPASYSSSRSLRSVRALQFVISAGLLVCLRPREQLAGLCSGWAGTLHTIAGAILPDRAEHHVV